MPHIKNAQVRHMSAFVSQAVTLSSVFCSLTMLALQKGHADQTRHSRLRNAVDVMLWPMSLLSENMTSPCSLPEHREVQLYGQCNMCMKRQRHTQDSNCSSQAVATAQYSAGLHPVCYLLQHPQQAVSQAGCASVICCQVEHCHTLKRLYTGSQQAEYSLGQALSYGGISNSQAKLKSGCVATWPEMTACICV